MDRSFLSQPEVIDASRKFVCIRLLTYEDRREADFLKTLFLGGSGDLENTLFTMLSPDGKRPLIRPSRSARHSFGSAAEMVQTMNRIATQHQARNTEGTPELPKIATVRLALDVSACDNQPLAVLFARDPSTLQRLETAVQKLAWSEDFLGQLTYVATSAPADLKAIEGASPVGGLLIIQTDRFGLRGKVLAQVAEDSSPVALAKAMRTGIRLYQPIEKTLPNHIRDGHHGGVFWDTQIPVTDPMERHAREQGRQRPPPPR